MFSCCFSCFRAFHVFILHSIPNTCLSETEDEYELKDEQQRDTLLTQCQNDLLENDSNYDDSQADAVYTAIREAWQSLDLLQSGPGLAFGCRFSALNRHYVQVKIQLIDLTGVVL